MLPYRDSKTVRIALILFFILLLIYAYFEARGLLNGPVIEVPTTTVTLSSPYTLIKGRALRITTLKLNGKSIPVTEDGSFEEPYLLAEGLNRLVLEAQDSRGRISVKTLDIMYTSSKTPPVHNTSSTSDAMAP